MGDEARRGAARRGGLRWYSARAGRQVLVTECSESELLLRRVAVWPGQGGGGSTCSLNGVVEAVAGAWCRGSGRGVASRGMSFLISEGRLKWYRMGRLNLDFPKL